MAQISPDQEPTKPTFIINPPRKLKTPGIRRAVWHFDCDDGKTYNLAEIADIVGIHYHSFLQRIRRYGWDSELVMMPPAPKGQFVGGQKFACYVSTDNGETLSGNDEWRAMSRDSRKSKLKDMKHYDPGIWEIPRLSIKRNKSKVKPRRSNKASENTISYGGLPYGRIMF